MVIKIRTAGVFQGTSLYGILSIHRVDAGHIQSHRIKGCKHPHIRYDRKIVLGMAVTVGGDVDDKVHMEMRSFVQNRLAVFCDLIIQNFVGFVFGRFYRIFGTDTNTAAAADACLVINGGLLVRDARSPVCTDFFALSAADAKILVDIRFSGRMHFHLAGPGAAAHTDVFQGAAETGQLVAFEMIHGKEDIRVHNSPSDLCLFDVFTSFYRDIYVVGSFQTIGDQHMTAGIVGIKAVLVCTFDVIQRIFASAHIEGVAVGQEGPAAQMVRA